MKKSFEEIKTELDRWVKKYNQPNFVENDPIQIPHLFSNPHDIEIIGFWTAILAWGNRKSIIKSAKRLVELMDGAPYDFIINHKEEDRKRFLEFKHRTFQPTDALYFLDFFQRFYSQNSSLESIFIDKDIKQGLIDLRHHFFDIDYAPQRTQKHIASPAKRSTCKRLIMFLRWMVRDDNKGVDFGIWKNIDPSGLYIPVDVHVEKIAKQLGIIDATMKRDWRMVESITEFAKSLDKKDPAKYDFALFGMGVDKPNL